MRVAAAFAAAGVSDPVVTFDEGMASYDIANGRLWPTRCCFPYRKRGTAHIASSRA
jgi:hypothetical protein